MRRPSCRSHRPAAGGGGDGGRPTIDIRAAIAILSVLLQQEPLGVAVLWLGAGGRLLDRFVVRGGVEALEEICRPVLEARSSPVAAVVLGTALPDGRRRPGKSERRRFRELRDRHTEAGVELGDWIVFGPSRTWSMAEEVRRPER